MSQTDVGSILFPSITICKDEMFTSEGAFLPKLQSGEVSMQDARAWFKNRTWSR